MKFCIGWDLLDGIKKWHIYLNFVEDLNYLIHVWIQLVVLQPIRKWYCRLVHRPVDLSVSNSSDLKGLGLDEVHA